MRRNDTIRITSIFLKMMGVKTSPAVMKEFFANHIYKDSLLSVQDFISDTGLNTKAIRYNKPDIGRLPTPFIVALQSGPGGQNAFGIVSEISDTSVKMLDSVTYKWREVDKSVFIGRWSRVALLAEDGRSQVVRQAAQRSGCDGAAVVMQVAIGLILLLLFIRFTVTNVSVYGISALNILGILISFRLVKLDFGYNDSITTRFCNINGKLNCNELLASKGASLFGIKWAIIGLAYFAANFLLSLFIFLFRAEYAPGLFVASWFPLGFTVYSVVYQWVISRKWCVLCLSVQGLLIFEFFILLGDTGHSFYRAGRESMIDAFLVIALIHLVSLYIVNFVLAKRYRFIESTKIKFLAYKRAMLSSDAFNHFTITAHRTVAPELGIFIGNPRATNSILLVSTPSCRYCSDSMLDLLSLIRGSYNIRVQVIFLCNTPGAESDEEIVNFFLNLDKQEGPTAVCDALYYWVLKKPSALQLLHAFPLKEAIKDCKEDIKNMASWCAAQNIASVPALFVNGRTLPYVYDIKDLKFALE